MVSRSPSRAESNAPALESHFSDPGSRGAAEVLGVAPSCSVHQNKRGDDDFIDVESIRGDDKLFARVPAGPSAIRYIRHGTVRIFAVILWPPICRPVRRTLKNWCSKLSGSIIASSLVRFCHNPEPILGSFQSLVIVPSAPSTIGISCALFHRLKVGLCAEKGVRRSNTAAARLEAIALTHIPATESCAGARVPKSATLRLGRPRGAQFAPEFRFCPGIQISRLNSLTLQIGSLSLIEDGERIEFPHRGFGQ